MQEYPQLAMLLVKNQTGRLHCRSPQDCLTDLTLRVEALEETLIGYRNPDVNDSDANREEACQAAFEEKFPGMEYEERND